MKFLMPRTHKKNNIQITVSDDVWLIGEYGYPDEFASGYRWTWLGAFSYIPALAMLKDQIEQNIRASISEMRNEMRRELEELPMFDEKQETSTLHAKIDELNNRYMDLESRYKESENCQIATENRITELQKAYDMRFAELTRRLTNVESIASDPYNLGNKKF